MRRRHKQTLFLLALTLAACGTGRGGEDLDASSGEDAAMTETDGGGDAGFATPLAPARPIFPWGGLAVLAPRVSFRVLLEPDSSAALIEFCADLECSRVIDRIRLTDETGDADLPPGTRAWRAIAVAADGRRSAPSATLPLISLQPRSLRGGSLGYFQDTLARVVAVFGGGSGVFLASPVECPGTMLGDLDGDGWVESKETGGAAADLVLREARPDGRCPVDESLPVPSMLFESWQDFSFSTIPDLSGDRVRELSAALVDRTSGLTPLGLLYPSGPRVEIYPRYHLLRNPGRAKYADFDGDAAFDVLAVADPTRWNALCVRTMFGPFDLSMPPLLQARADCFNAGYSWPNCGGPECAGVPDCNDVARTVDAVGYLPWSRLEPEYCFPMDDPTIVRHRLSVIGDMDSNGRVEVAITTRHREEGLGRIIGENLLVVESAEPAWRELGRATVAGWADPADSDGGELEPVVLGDVLGDGGMEIGWRNRIFTISSGSFQELSLPERAGTPVAMDVDSDGQLDLATEHDDGTFCWAPGPIALDDYGSVALACCGPTCP